MRVRDEIEPRRNKALLTADYIARRTEIDYATYVKMRGNITLK